MSGTFEPNSRYSIDKIFKLTLSFDYINRATGLPSDDIDNLKYIQLFYMPREYTRTVRSPRRQPRGGYHPDVIAEYAEYDADVDRVTESLESAFNGRHGWIAFIWEGFPYHISVFRQI